MEEVGTSFSVTELILGSSFGVQMIMLILLISSLISWKVIFEYSNKIKKAEKEMKLFKGELLGSNKTKPKPITDIFLSKTSYEVFGIYRTFKKSFHFVYNNSKMMSGTEKLDSSYEKSLLEIFDDNFNLEMEKAHQFYKNNLTILGIISSSAPYVGLLGTVYGILIAFWNLGAVQQATIATVAPSIAEALIATGMGLFVAIPALVSYNRLVHRVDVLMDDYINVMDTSKLLLNKKLMMSLQK